MPTVSRQPFFNPIPLALLAASFATGVLLARMLDVPLAAWLACAAVSSVLGVSGALLPRGTAQGGWLVLVAFMCAGALLASIEKGRGGETRVRRFYAEGCIASGEPVELTGVLERTPEWSPDGFRLTLGVERLRAGRDEWAASGRVELFAQTFDEGGAGETTREAYESLELRRGARVRVLVSLRRTEKFRNPGVSSALSYLEQHDIEATGTVKSPLLVERLGDERVFLPLVLLDGWRGRMLRLVNKTFSDETAGVLNATLLGNREGLSRGVAERFRAGGTFHVLVISGMHITFIGGLVWWLARLLTRRRAWQMGVALVVTWSYAVAVGAEASVVRAALMFSAVICAPLLSRRASSTNALGGAALVLLVWRTDNLFDPSFQLTFLSVLAIVGVAWPLLSKLKAAGKWRPTRSTPYPPAYTRLWRLLGEALFWDEDEWRRELARGTCSYRLFKTPLASRLRRRRMQRPLRYVFAALLVSACVQLVMLPLLVVYFHRISLVSPALNVFVGAGVGLLSLLSLLSIGVAQAGAWLAAPLVWLTERTAWFVTHSVDPFETAGVASMRVPEYAGHAGWLYVLYYAPLLLLAVALARWQPVARVLPLRAQESHAEEKCDAPHAAMRRVWKRAVLKFSAWSLVALLVVIAAHPWSAPSPDGRLRVDFLDVGQGDAALLTMPDGTTLLVDGGGRPRFEPHGLQADAAEDAPFERDARSIGEAVVSEYLWWRGLDAVDYVLATHADADHIDGLGDVMKNFRVRAALAGRAPPGDAGFRRFAATASERGVPVYLVGRGDTLNFGEVKVDVLWPSLAGENSVAPSRNNDSIVLRLRYGQRTFLLGGDIEERAEAALAATGDDLRSDAVKVAHHGSRTSSTPGFVTSARPALAVISVGQDSPYGHPHAEVIKRWHDAGAQLLTTGRRGMITVSTDGADLKVETFVRR